MTQAIGFFILTNTSILRSQNGSIAMMRHSALIHNNAVMYQSDLDIMVFLRYNFGSVIGDRE